MNSVNMKLWGLNDEFLSGVKTSPEQMVARVISQERGIYEIISDRGSARAAVSGKFRFQTDAVSEYPAVGDFVLYTPNENGQAVINEVLPRKSVFLRKAAGTSNREQVVAANVDTIFLCMSLNRDYNLRRLERYLSVAWDSGAMPVIVLTKYDLCGEPESRRKEVEEIALGVDILMTSDRREDGFVSLYKYLKEGQTVAFIGSSGVGKSTLINRLLGEETLAINGLRSDDKGKHTTTHRELIKLPGKGMVIDTPGMRELGMWDSAEGVEKAFGDIEELIRMCRFRNCTHTTEPGCAVIEALRCGTISEERYHSFKKLLKESAWAENSESYLAAKEKKFKEISRINKSRRK